MNQAQLINQTSSDVEYYTDPLILAAARAVMDGIDLDPASSAKANENVKADLFYGFQASGLFLDGLSQHWNGTIWLNHPFGRREAACAPDCKREHVHHAIDFHGNQAWIDKLFEEVELCNVRQALCITYAATSEKWFQQLLACPICFLCPRTNYYLPDGTKKSGVTKGSAIAYLGREATLDRFIQHFRPFGQIKVNP